MDVTIKIESILAATLLQEAFTNIAHSLILNCFPNLGSRKGIGDFQKSLKSKMLKRKNIKLFKLLKLLGGVKSFKSSKKCNKFNIKLFSKFGIQARDWGVSKIFKVSKV